MSSRLPSSEKLALVKRAKKGEPIARLCREARVSRTIFYRWLKRYELSGPRTKRSALKSRRPSGTRHWRSINKRIEWNLLNLASKDPSASCQKYAGVLSKRFDKKISAHGVWRILRRHKLTALENRIAWADSRGRRVVIGLSPKTRGQMIEAVTTQGRTVSEVSSEFGVSRQTFYKWFRQHQSGIDDLIDRRPSGDKHWRAILGIDEEILSLVLDYPQWGSARIAQKLADIRSGRPSLGNHGVYNFLKRKNLNLFERRLAYAKIQRQPVQPQPASFLDRVRLVWEEFIPSLAPAPPPKVRQLLKPFLASLFFAFLISFATLSWIRLLGGAGFVGAVGLTFASIALLMGSFFFLYSLKYYLTLAIVLSFSQTETGKKARGKRGGFLSWILGLGNGDVESRQGGTTSRAIGLEPSLEHVVLKRYPFISVHIPLYNEKNVVERAIKAATNFEYQGDYEVILADDSTDETSEIIQDYFRNSKAQISKSKGDGWTLTQVEVRPGVVLKHLHRTSRSGFKGGALRLALSVTDPEAEFISVFDADFVPYPDTLELFLKYFQVTAGSLDFKKVTSDQWLVTSEGKQNKPTNYQLPITNHSSNIAAVQGYQWHVLNKSENWITRGVRSEYAGSYVIERSGAEIYSGLKQISGAVYMIRRDVLEEIGWETSITEDFQLTLKLYEKGYKVVYTPYIQAPAECVSTLKRLIRQRMRWAEGHSHNVRKMFVRLLLGSWKTDDGGQKTETEERKQMTENQPSVIGLQNPSSAFSFQSSRSQSSRTWVSSPLTLMEKLEFLYLSPYYLQAFFFLVGTFSWLISETLFPARLPFWTSLWGWSLVLTNFLSLPLMNAVGLFLEESEQKDYLGLTSFVILSYVLVPFQAYASIKGFIEREGGPWFRTPKTGRITDIIRRGTFYRLIAGILPVRATPAIARMQANSASGLKLMEANSPYLGLATANNRFNSFSISPRRKRWIGKTGVALVVLLALFVNYLGLFVQTTQAAAPGGEWWDTNYAYRQKITVTAGTAAVPTAYSVWVTFDHAALVTASKSQADGDDVRILYWNGSTWTELDRVLDVASSWNSATTKIWFKLQAAIAASGSDDNYYIYYGYSGAATPPTNRDNIYLFWDGFEAGNLNKWTALVDSMFTVATDQANSGTYSMKMVPGSGGKFIVASGLNVGDIVYESYWRLSDVTPGGWSIDGGPSFRFATSLPLNGYMMDLETGNSPEYGWQFMKIVNGTYLYSTADITNVTNYGTPQANVWQKWGIIIKGQDAKFLVNDAQITPPSGWATFISTTFASGSVGAWMYAIPAGQAAWMDDAVVRKYVDPEPTTARSTEEVVPEVVLLLLPLAILLPFILKRRFVPVSVPIRP